MILRVPTENVYWKANALPGAAEVCFKFCRRSHKVLPYEQSRIKEYPRSFLGVAAAAEEVTVPSRLL